MIYKNVCGLPSPESLRRVCSHFIHRESLGSYCLKKSWSAVMFRSIEPPIPV